jgi:hypothetical protein
MSGDTIVAPFRSNSSRAGIESRSGERESCSRGAPRASALAAGAVFPAGPGVVNLPENPGRLRESCTFPGEPQSFVGAPRSASMDYAEARCVRREKINARNPATAIPAYKPLIASSLSPAYAGEASQAGAPDAT